MQKAVRPSEQNQEVNVLARVEDADQEMRGSEEQRDSEDEDEEREGEESERFSLDYCFLEDENGSRITFLVEREPVTGMTMAPPTQFAAMKVLEFVKERGAAESDTTLKTDQELVIEAQLAGAEKSGETERGGGRSVGRRGVKKRHAGAQRPGREEKGRG